MRALLFFLLLSGIAAHSGIAQDTIPPKPWYCNPPAGPMAARAVSAAPSATPRMPTQAVTCYKVQVAILTRSNPRDFPFHPKLVARYRPCEEVWVIESRDTYEYREQAEEFVQEMLDVGYKGAYVTEIVGYE